MIVVDAAEKPYILKELDDRKVSYKVEDIRLPKSCEKIPIFKEDKTTLCIPKTDFEILKGIEKLEVAPLECEACEFSSEKVGDFTNENKAFIVERKRVDDYYASMVDGRLYEQARKMYKWCSGIKAIILEGMPQHVFLSDSQKFNPFSEYDKMMTETSKKSPLKQLIEMHPDKKSWILSTIEDLASCDVVLMQSYDLGETIEFIIQMDKGAGIEPKIRYIPKKIGGLSLDEQILATIPGIGKVRSQQLIGEYGDLRKLISAIRKMSKKDVDKYQITKKLKEVFG